MVRRNEPCRLTDSVSILTFMLAGALGIFAGLLLPDKLRADENSVVRYIEENSGTSRHPSPLPSQTELFGRLNLDASVAGGPAESKYRENAQPAYTGTRTSQHGKVESPQWFANDFTWAAPALRHQALYFEQVNLERYGQGPRRVWQPAYSAAHFFGSAALLPLHVLQHSPTTVVYTLGHYRPGDCVPYQHHSCVSP